ncbi:thiolase family protein [Yinghuangia seranimata]|uniref:thiolase family protein n=1 Tax=Yinghuangia seranimata TaxID=408067 RepID=UPI00248B6DA8|nr:thiolase family protein [Yinghuangia seranimata]MDI2126056.1 thiolase family protein [Yinghuangia seranimata]
MAPGSHPYRGVAIAGVHNTAQARALPGHTSLSITVDAVHGALADAGLTLDDVDGVSAADLSARLIHDLRVGPAWRGTQYGLGMIAEAAAAIAAGMCDVAVVASGEAGVYTERAATAPWTRPENEFVIPWGLFTAAEFALIARRHMIEYGTTEDQLAVVAATIRNNGHVNPDAVYHGRGPYTPADIRASRPIADPFRLLDCAITSEGGCALVLTAADRAPDLPHAPVYLLGMASDCLGPAYQHPPAYDLAGRRAGQPSAGLVGQRAADRAFRTAGLSRADVDVLELYDPFSFEVIRQLEAFGFCAPGEGGPFVADGHIAPDGNHPVTTDGGLLSYSHAGSNPQMLQRAIRAVQQVRGTCASTQIPGARVALASAGGSGALFSQVALFGTERP